MKTMSIIGIILFPISLIYLNGTHYLLSLFISSILVMLYATVYSIIGLISPYNMKTMSIIGIILFPATLIWIFIEFDSKELEVFTMLAILYAILYSIIGLKKVNRNKVNKINDM